MKGLRTKAKVVDRSILSSPPYPPAHRCGMRCIRMPRTLAIPQCHPAICYPLWLCTWHRSRSVAGRGMTCRCCSNRPQSLASEAPGHTSFRITSSRRSPCGVRTCGGWACMCVRGCMCVQYLRIIHVLPAVQAQLLTPHCFVHNQNA